MRKPTFRTEERVQAIRHMLDSGVNPYKIAKELNISTPLYNYYYKTYIKNNNSIGIDSNPNGKDLKSLQTQAGENPAGEARDILKRYSPTLAQILVDIAINPSNSARERRQAAKDGLFLAGITGTEDRLGEGLGDMKVVLAKIYKDCNITLENVDKRQNSTEIVDVESSEPLIERK